MQRSALCAAIVALLAPCVAAERAAAEFVGPMAIGWNHSCGPWNDGTLLCWGWNEHGQVGNGTLFNPQAEPPTPVDDISGGVLSVGAGHQHTCAVTTAGEALCWGDNSGGQLGDGSGTWQPSPVTVSGLGSGVAAVASGAFSVCALTGAGGVKCWGTNFEGELGDGTTTPSDTPVDVVGLGSGVTAIDHGGSHACAITTGGGLKCWGEGANGRLGDGNSSDSSVPVQVSGLTSGVLAIALGSFHTCALTATEVLCWGGNDSGQLGYTGSNATTPMAVPGNFAGATGLAAGSKHTCVTDADGHPHCWGRGFEGQLGDGTTTLSRQTPAPVAGALEAVSVTAGFNGTCALLASGEAFCWGANGFGNLDAKGPARILPTRVPTHGSDALLVEGGGSHACATTQSGSVLCWGRNDEGQVGDGSTEPRPLPTPVSDLTGADALAAGSGHTCALAGGGVKCWGRGGRLGDGTSAQSSVPVGVSGMTSGVAAISAFDEHTCAVKSAGSVHCWGRNDSGQLGDGTTNAAFSPVAVPSLASGIVAVATGSAHSCALDTGGGVSCWGANFSGQLGDGTNTESGTPVSVSGLPPNVAAITAGSHHTCAHGSGSMRCWGQNDRGQLGDGTTNPSNVPIAVATPLTSGTLGISGGGSHSCARRSPGDAWCFGFNSQGQLGDGGDAVGHSPVPVSGLDGVADAAAAIAAGGAFGCAITAAGALRCWGDNVDGQLGNGYQQKVTTPSSVFPEPSGALGLLAAVGLLRVLPRVRAVRRRR